MSNLWPRIEPLLARVEKPARYIGMERGSQRPEHLPHQVAWLLLYPDAYEIGLPNQGLQILYEILNERDDAVAERAYAPWVDLEGELRASGVPLFSVDTHRAAGDFDVLAFNLSAELVYTNVLSCIDLAGVPVRAAARSVEHPLVIAGGHCAFNPEPLADFVDAFVIGDGEEPVGEITEVLAAWKRAGRPTREGVLRELATIPGVYVPAMYDVEYDGPRLVATTPRYPDVPAVVDKRTVADLAEWPYPKQQLVPLIEVVHDRLNVEIFRGLHARLPLLPGGDDHATGARAPARPGAHDGRRRPAPHRLRRSRAHIAVERRLLGDRRPRRRHRQRAVGHRLRVALAAVAARRRVHGRHRSRDPEGAPYRAHVRARGGHVADAPGHQQADHRGRPLRRGRRCVLAGLAAREALLPHRTAHRERRRHARHRRSGQERREDRQAAHQGRQRHRVGRRVRAEAAHALPVVRPELGGGAAPQGRDAARCPAQGRRAPQVARPPGDVRRGHRQPGRPPHRRA